MSGYGHEPESIRRIKVLFVNSAGGGFAKEVELPAGTTVDQLFQGQRVSTHDKKILVNGSAEITGNYMLKHGDRISATFVKYEGN